MTAKQRVQDELEQLQYKLDKLDKALEGRLNNPNHFVNNLPADQRRLLLHQQAVMHDYANILQQRLNIWVDKNEPTLF